MSLATGTQAQISYSPVCIPSYLMPLSSKYLICCKSHFLCKAPEAPLTRFTEHLLQPLLPYDPRLRYSPVINNTPSSQTWRQSQVRKEADRVQPPLSPLWNPTGRDYLLHSGTHLPTNSGISQILISCRNPRVKSASPLLATADRQLGLLSNVCSWCLSHSYLVPW